MATCFMLLGRYDYNDIVIAFESIEMGKSCKNVKKIFIRKHNLFTVFQNYEILEMASVM